MSSRAAKPARQQRSASSAAGGKPGNEHVDVQGRSDHALAAAASVRARSARRSAQTWAIALSASCWSSSGDTPWKGAPIPLIKLSQALEILRRDEGRNGDLGLLDQHAGFLAVDLVHEVGEVFLTSEIFIVSVFPVGP
jgi:hypothetical protein